MQRRLGVLGLAVASHRSVSVVLGVRERVVRAHRHHVLSWLIEQPTVWAVQLGELSPLADALVRGLPAHPVVDVTCVAGVPRCRLEGYAQQTLRAVVRKALAEREAKRLQGWAG
ncbi:hypothetical protein AAW51_0870 [Caldimonas brevitalea]|uniref:Uncharacterized protein n=2 Tax=Caldimonas brevitalea TaxID=413882 RepID=A0A0G3BJK6_9BURK|nr:hypothetical protein AAW51_0870 [Caldimonas brevitalea]